MKKRILSCFMALALCLTLLPTAALAADGMTHTPSHSGKELKMDNTLMKDGAVWNPTAVSTYGSDTETSYALDGGDYYLGSDLTIDHPIMINGNVKLCLNSFSITCASPAPNYVIAVYANTNSELTLTDCKTTGKIEGGKSAAVELRRGYTLNMHGGTITGGVNMSGNTEGSPTKFNMYGGTISNNTGIGVRLTESCTFTMSGGTISGNKGGVSTGGTFTMTSGEISGNTATRDGGGVYVNGGTFTMNGGEIKSNTAEINGGGVYVNRGAFTMNGGEIKNNTANTAGGGVLVQDGTFTVSGQPIVSENTSGTGDKVTDNVYLPAKKTITIGSGLTGGTIGSGLTGGTIGVTTGSANAPTETSTVAITKATENAHGYLDYFKSDNDSYEIKANEQDTQLELKAKPKIPLTSSNTKITITNADGAGDFVYSGKEITPTVTVTYKGSTDGNTTLVQDKDYTVTSGGSGTDATGYTLKITGTGNYTGKVEKKWTIKPLIVSVSSVTLNDKVYDGTCIGNSSDVASVTFEKGSKQSVLLQKEDYTIESVTYKDANAGTQNADIIIKLAQNGNYTFAGNTQTTQVGAQGKITKAPADSLTPQPGKINVVNNKEDTYTLDLSKLLPTLPDGCKYGEIDKYGKIEITYKPDKDSFNLGNYNSGKFSISNDGILTLPIKAVNGEVNKTIGTGQVTVTTQNYGDITLTINVKAVAAPPKEPEYTAPKPQSGLVYNKQAQKLITGGTATNGTMQYSLTSGSGYSTDIPMATNAGDYIVYYKVVGNSGYSNIAEQSISVHIDKAKPTGEPIYTKITAAKKTLAAAELKPNTSWPTGTVKWELPDTTEVEANTAYKWIFTPTGADADNYTTADGELTLYSVSTGGGSSSGGYDSYDSNPIIKTETKNNPDGSTTKTETRKDGTVTATTTAKDGSTSKTTTNPNGSSVTENKAANGSTGTVKTDKNGQTTAETTLSSKAIEDAKKSGEPVKAPVEVKAARNSGAAPTVKVELPQNAGKTEVEIPVSNANAGTVAVLVRPDGTEEILKDSIPTEDGIRLTVDGSAAVKIVDNAKDFIDTQNHWAKDEIDFVSARELVNGISATRYAPDATATRAQLWTILARQNDTDLSGGANWYEKAQLWSKDKGISDGTNPGATITRAQMVTMLWRTMGQPAATDKVSFADVPAGSYYEQAVAWAVESGITQGVGGDRFDPNATCTRAQIAAFLARSMK